MERIGDVTADIIRTQLRRLRVAAGLNQEEFGKLVHYSASMVSALELGQRPLEKKFLTRADEALGTGGLLTSLHKLVRLGGHPLWFQPWLDAEQTAKQLRSFQPSLIPGLLQTERYARAVLRTDDVLSDEAVDERLADRLERQAILHQDEPPHYIVVLDEAVLRRTGEGFTDLMAEQLQNLVTCAERPHVSVHVIPAEVVMHVGLSGPFVLARGSDGGWVGHLETQLGGVVVDDEEDVSTLLSRWETVRNEALPRRQSLDLIKEVLKAWT